MPATFQVVETAGDVKGFKGHSQRPDGLADGADTESTSCLLPPMLLLRRFTDFARPTQEVPLNSVYLALGLLRSLLKDCDSYNAALRGASRQDGASALKKAQVVELFSGLGVSPSGREIDASGLGELIGVVEAACSERLEQARAQVQAGVVEYTSLAELYLPGARVVGPVGGMGEQCGFEVRSCRFHEHKTLFGTQLSFHLELQYVGSVGDRFAVLCCQDELGSFQGTRSINSLPYRPLCDSDRDVSIHARLEQRGCTYVEAAVGAKMHSYSPGSFLAGGASTARTRRAGIGRPGRIMIDVETALEYGTMIAPGSDYPSLAFSGVAARYPKARRQGRLSKENSKKDQSLQHDTATGMMMMDGMCFFDALPSQLVWCCWPTLLGFSFTAKIFGHVMVDGLGAVPWDKHAWNGLVIPQGRKDLLHAVVINQREVGGVDLIAGKGEGTTFLLYGPPGTGKTLTAEAMAELLERPLYVMSAGELGTSPEVTEQNLSEALELCSKWDAIALIDEADILLEERTSGDIMRNAMLCVALRVLEYHSGVLFLTTNKAQGIDTAVQSRLTLALKYDALDEATRCEVWSNLLQFAGCDPSAFQVPQLGPVVINGRQIKNCIRLALALARQRGVQLSDGLLQSTLAIVSDAQNDLSTPVVGSPLKAVRAMKEASGTDRQP
mmetsp:Transcript_153632/g.492431  ORF Transcript_153632/g.492431 Transcript_153632/m.492431 type:complete len:669 (+) Transcript_153632:83-2089(+)|eukprot:CAMPEP_0203971334 /NCGR_PEP_ID=MMETSP0359-20131031/98420_1 /ASSEMBLY_ACC=CAM_ASM_000338 /TAXON_ID=268821 /ORGANISM="Scrippsiella Hangoei, Strain SHTV-5" /LENGTH=668 /DNA_ID=CAMNT_0050909305 /DNA_START=83 /DNA_END=2089 /DNA_ORIENTATION=+